MKRILLMIAALLLSACPHTSKEVRPPVASSHFSSSLLPEPLGALYLGMPFEEFARLRPVAEMERYDGMSFRFQLTEKLPKGNIEAVTYYFDVSLDGQPLYELILEFSPKFDFEAWAVQQFGPPQENLTRWRIDSREGFPIDLWTTDHKLVIAGVIRGTEWNDPVGGEPASPEGGEGQQEEGQQEEGQQEEGR